MKVLPLLLGGGAIAALFALAKKSPMGIKPIWIPVMLASGQVEQGVKAQWHATDEQSKLFGPRYANFWSRNGYFLFKNAKGGFDQYKPNWRVPIEARA
jgi:hypothetical protein